MKAFIPTVTKNNLKINFIDEQIRAFLTQMDANITDFESNYFSWIELSFEENYDLIIMLNGFFWENYFIDYNVFEEKNISRGHSFYDNSKIHENISKISNEISDIVKLLKSNTFLTNTKKEEIKKRIISTLVSLSGVYFIQQNLKKISEDNYNELNELENNKHTEEEFKWQASILKEVTKTKIIELDASITKLENVLEDFLSLISDFLI